jgi:hypothetical protein
MLIPHARSIEIDLQPRECPSRSEYIHRMRILQSPYCSIATSVDCGETVQTPYPLPEYFFWSLGQSPIRASDLLEIYEYLASAWTFLSKVDADMVDTSAKLQDVVYLDTIDDEIGTTFASDRIAQEKKLLRKIDIRMMPMMMLICTCRPSDPCHGFLD